MNWEESEVLRQMKKVAEPMSIKDLAKEARLPRQKVYQVLEKLRREEKVDRKTRQEPKIPDFNVYFLKEEDGVPC